MSQAIEADHFMHLGKFGRCSEGRDGSLIGVNLAVPNEPAKEGRQPWIAVARCRPPFHLSPDDAASFAPVVGRTQAECRPGRDLERLGMPSQLDDGFGLQEAQLIEREPAFEEPGLRVPGVRGAEEPGLRVDRSIDRDVGGFGDRQAEELG